MIAQAVCRSYVEELLRGGLHRATDVYKIALYTSQASLSIETRGYTAVGEVPDSGTYVAGGQVMTGFVVTGEDATVSLNYTPLPHWRATTITARGALVYNATRAARAVAVLDFGEDVTSRDGLFIVEWPDPDPLIRVRLHL